MSHMSANTEVRLPLRRARTLIRRQLQSEGWKVRRPACKRSQREASA